MAPDREDSIRIVETTELTDLQWAALAAMLRAFEEGNVLRMRRDKIQSHALRLKGAVDDFIKAEPLTK